MCVAGQGAVSGCSEWCATVRVDASQGHPLGQPVRVTPSDEIAGLLAPDATRPCRDSRLLQACM